MKPQITIVNVQTGEEITRDMNDAELAQQAIDMAAKEAKDAAKAQAEADKAAAEAKLAKLGLTTDDLKALGL
jgi:hypothetical protein